MGELVSVRGVEGSAVSVVALSRPEAHNALNTGVRRELAGAASRLRDDEGVRAIVLTGTDRAFSVGADVRENGTTYAGGDFEWYAREYERANEWYRILSQYPKPIIAALSGYVAGAGLQLALCADILIAAPGLQFWLPQVSLGLSPHVATLAKLARVIGYQRALRLALTGERADADQALAWGLVSEIVPSEQLLSRAIEIAERIASHPGLATQMTKEALDAATGQSGDLIRLLDAVKTYGLIQSSSWQRKRAELTEKGRHSSER